MSVHEVFEYEQPELNEVFEFEQPEVQESQEYEYGSGELNEAFELELAQELLEVTNEAELEEFLGKLVRGVARGASAFMKSGIGQAVGGVLRNVARTALPMVGSALGSMVAPGLGTAIGGKLGGMAAKLLEAEELEVMGEGEAELEAARRYVRWAGGTVRSAMRAPYGTPSRIVARSAAVSSARRYAPRLLRPAYGRRQSQWRGRRGGQQPAPWDPAPYRGTSTCTCGSQHQGYGQTYGQDGGFEPFDADGQQPWSPEGSHQEGESQEYEVGVGRGASSTGRWYRRAGRIVLVGA